MLQKQSFGSVHSKLIPPAILIIVELSTAFRTRLIWRYFMNTFKYVATNIIDELHAIRDEFRQSKILMSVIFISIISLIFYLDPIPNRVINFSSDTNQSQWYSFAKDTRLKLQNSGINMTIFNTGGAVENATLINNPTSKINAGLTYGAALDESQIDGIYSLGSIAYETLFVFYNKNKIPVLKNLKDLANYKVALGPANSGSFVIAKDLFMALDVNVNENQNFSLGEFLKIRKRLLKGNVDAVIIVTNINDPLIRPLFDDPNMALYSFTNALAYKKHFSYFEAMTLPAGSIDLLKHIPTKDVSLISTSTSLIVSRDMHPDLQLALLMEIKNLIHSSPLTSFAKRNEFPKYIDTLIPISPIAQKFYNYGPTKAARFFPFLIAGFIDRIWLFALGLISIYYPLSKLNINVRTRRFDIKLQSYYKELLEIENSLYGNNISENQKLEFLKHLVRMNSDAHECCVPRGSEGNYFDLLNGIISLKNQIELIVT